MHANRLISIYLSLSPINSKAVIDYLSKKYKKRSEIVEVVQKPIFKACLECFGLIPFLLQEIVTYFEKEENFSEFNYQSFFTVLETALRVKLQKVTTIAEIDEFLTVLCYSSLLGKNIFDKKYIYILQL